MERSAQAEMSDLPLASNSIEVIICGLALGHLTPIAMRRAMLEMGRVLKPGGIALISDFHPFQAWQGGQRTFTGDDGRTYAVEHYIHSYADYFEFGRVAGLKLDAVREPCHPQVQGGKIPLILALRFIK